MVDQAEAIVAGPLECARQFVPVEQTVGTHIDLSHIAATPPGLEVTAKVKLVEVDGRRLVFEVEAHDGIDLITRGRHERFVINKEKFDRKMNDKIKKKKSIGCAQSVQLKEDIESK